MVRKATDAETEEILKHSFIVMKEATMGLVADNKDIPLQMMKQFLAQGGYYLVCVEGNIVKGWLAVGAYDDGFSEKPIGLFMELYVFPEFRKEGVAKELLKTGIKSVKEKQLDRIQLNVYVGNPAKKLYEQQGFYTVSTLMEKRLD